MIITWNKLFITLIKYCSMQSCSILFTVWWRHKVTMAATIVFLAWFFHFLYWGYLHTKLDIRLSWWVMAHRQKWPPHPSPVLIALKLFTFLIGVNRKLCTIFFDYFNFVRDFFIFFIVFLIDRFLLIFFEGRSYEIFSSTFSLVITTSHNRKSLARPPVFSTSLGKPC